MKLLFALFFLFFFLSVSAAPSAKDGSGRKRRTLHAKQRRWRADELKEHHRLMRKTHKDYVPYYPDAPILTYMTVGTPPVEYTVALESGTDALFLLAKDYPGRVVNQSFYDPQLSFTSVNTGDTYYGASGDIAASGTSYLDVVGLFLFEENTTQRFGAVTEVYSPFYPHPAMPDGIIGMSWNPADAANPNENSSAIINLFKEWQEPNRYWVEWIADGSTPEDGRDYDLEVAFGYFLDDYCEPMTSADTFPLVWAGGMGFNALAFAIDSFTYKGQQFAGGYAKVDTGEPQIALPDDSFLAVYNDVQPAFDWDYGLYTIDCSLAGTLPDWTFTIGGNSYAIPSTAYVVDLFLPDGQCAWSAKGTDFEDAPFVLGYVFHKLWCIKMDIDNQAIGISKVIPPPNSLPAVGTRSERK